MTAALARAAPHSLAAQQLVSLVRAARSHGLASPRRKVPLTRWPTLIESDYAARLVAIVDRMRVAARQLVAELPQILRADTAGFRLDDDPGRQARNAMERVRTEVEGAFDEHAFERVAADFGQRVSHHQKGELSRQAKAALGVDVVNLDPKIPPLIRGFVHENVALIKKLQGSALDHVETLVTRAVTSGTRAEAVAKEIEARFGMAERHARLIARDQIGKLNGQITAVRHQELGIKRFRWRSMHDGKVRPAHRVLDGQLFSYDKPPAEGLPGQPICCRCVPEPDFSDIHAAAAGELDEQLPAGRGIGFDRVIGEADAGAQELAETPDWSVSPRIAGEDEVAAVDPEAPPPHKETILEMLSRTRPRYVHQRPELKPFDPAAVKAAEAKRQEDLRRAREKYEAARPIIAPPGYHVVEDFPGIKTYVSDRTGIRYTEMDVRRGTLDPAVPAGDFPTATAKPKGGILSRAKAAVKRVLRIDGELVTPPGWDTAGRELRDGVPDRDEVAAGVAYVVAIEDLAAHGLVAPSRGGDDTGPVTERRLARIRNAWARNRKLSAVRIGLLPDGRLLITDGRHRLLVAAQERRLVLVRFSPASERDGEGAVRIDAPTSAAA